MRSIETTHSTPVASAARNGKRPAFGRQRLALLAGASGVAMGLIVFGSGDALARALNGGGGGGAQSAPNIASDAAAQAAAQAAATAQQTQQSLARAARAVQDMQAVQAAARAAAAAAHVSATAPIAVPNGLGTGGLLPGGGMWSGATAPTQGSDGKGQTEVTIRQTTQQAILNWQSFNVGARTTLTFDQQGNASWVALNRVNEISTAPSQILGRIKADGHVYVINKNGIIFGGNSQVNVGSLIASTAAIDDDQFRNNGIYSAQSGSTYRPSFTAAGGKVVVEAGAVINTRAPSSVTAGGGYVLMIGSEVSNNGSITTPKGQTILAAGDNFVLRRGFGTDGNTASTTRGTEITSLIAAGSSNGLVTNSGLVLAQQGDITLVGRSIVQHGALISTTSVNTRGTIHLLNRASDASGQVLLGKDSVTVVMPELDSRETALDGQRDALIAASTAANLLRYSAVSGVFDNLSQLADRQDQSRIEIVTGGIVTFNGGSTTAAQGGQIAISAGQRIVAEDGARLDSSGVRNVSLAMASNNLKINIQGNELRDSPQNRDSNTLRNGDVWIDIRNLTLLPAGTGGYASDRYYTEGGLLEIGGYLANTAHTIGEWSAVGGSITLSGPEAVAQRGAVFNISGGSLDYAAGWIRSTNLIGSDGRRYSVDKAPGDIEFVGFAGSFSRKHNIQGRVDERLTEIWTTVFDRGRTSLRWEEGYSVGRDAGRLVLAAPTSAFDATILADTLTGERQNAKRAAGITDGYKAPQSVVAQNGTLALQTYDGNTSVPRWTALDSEIRFGNSAAPADRTGTIWLNADMLADAQLGGLLAWSTRDLAVNGALRFAPGAVIDLQAPNVIFAAGIKAPGGRVTAGNEVVGRGPLLDSKGTSSMTMRDGAVIDTRGLWTNALIDPSAGLWREAFIDGGDVTLRTSGDITIEAGARIDSSAGGSINVSRKFSGGNGGDIALTVVDLTGTGTGGGRLTLGGDLASLGFIKGGALTLETGGTVSIGGAGTLDSLHLATEFFGQGFSSYLISGQKGVTVARQAAIAVTMPVYQNTSALFALPSDGSLGLATTPSLAPLYLENARTRDLTQRAGADITLRSESTGTEGFITIGRGASITVDPGRNVSLTSAKQITVDGHITAPSGNITIRDSNAALPTEDVFVQASFYDPGSRSIWIGDSAVLDVSARSHVARDMRGRSYGIVADGGSIVLGGTGVVDRATTIRDSAISYVVVRPGAVLDASGTSAELTLFDDKATGGRAVMAASNGGSITAASRAGLYIDGTLRARAGGVTASGGSLSLVFETPLFSETSASFIPANLLAARILTVGQSRIKDGLPRDAEPARADAGLAIGHGHVTADQIMAGGFDAVELSARGGITFDGDVSLATGRSLILSHSGFASGRNANRIWQGTLANSEAGATVRLQSAYVGLIGMAALQTTLVVPNVLPATPTGGTLDIRAGLIDLQSEVRSKFADTVLTSTGDIRIRASSGGTTMVGTAGNLTLVSQQLYPTSGAFGNLFAGMDGLATSIVDANAMLRIVSIDGSRPALPPSVYGSLALSAPNVEQGGVVRAPLGELIIGIPRISNANNTVFNTRVELLAGSITSISANGLIMPYGGTTDGVNYSVNGGAAVAPDLMSGAFGTARTRQGIMLHAGEVVSAAGSIVDLSGGGHLTGAGFVSGRGGSVDVLVTPLANANPANRALGSDAVVYAIVPGTVTAPPTGNSNTSWTGAEPAIGRQVTIPAGVPGLPAGTYMLLPANYALLPGAFRVEVAAGQTSVATAAFGIANGSTVVSGTLGFANTVIRDVLPTRLLLTPGDKVRSYSQYNEQSYASFQLAQAARFGTVRPLLERDGKILSINLMALDGGNVGSNARTTRDALVFEGSALFAAAADGYGGTLSLGSADHGYFPNTQVTLAITKAGSITARTSSFTPVADATINAIGAPNVVIGGNAVRTENQVGWDVNQINPAPRSILIDSGAVIRGSQVVLAASSNITLAPGARIDTLGWGVQAPDSKATGYTYGRAPSSGATMAALLVVSNGSIAFSLPVGTTGNVTIGDGATLLSEGTVGFLVPGSLAVNGSPLIGTRSLNLTVPTLNVGTASALASAQAAGTLPVGLALDQSLFDRLLAGGIAAGAPALESLVLGASNSINFFGSVSLNATDPVTGRSRLQQFELNSPAIYGAGAAGDQVKLTADALIWNGSSATSGSRVVGSKTPGATIPGGPGAGAGTITVNARRIVLGYGADQVTYSEIGFDRLMLGFAGVTLNASEAIVANNRGTLSVFASGPSPDATYNAKTYAGIGGSLNLVSPLLTGDAGAVLAIRVGGSVTLAQPAGAASPILSASALGADIAISAGGSVHLDSTIHLPSGKLSVTAAGDVVLGGNSRLDLSGKAIPMFDVTKYSWGGDIALETTQGNIVQLAGSVIDLSALNSDAGSLALTATGSSAGGVVLGGLLRGTGTRGGAFDLRAQTIGASPTTLSADFAALNTALTTAGFTERRSFVLKQGDLVIGDELKAHDIAVSVDGGSLVVVGRIDASGERVGSIRLAAKGDMTLASSAVLDAHGTVLQTDGVGVAIAAKNRAVIELASADGTLRLAGGAVIDLSSADGAARGSLSLYARRVGAGTGATGAGAPANAVGNDVAIEAGSGLRIGGAREIALYGTAVYANAPADPNDPRSQVIDKAWLDLVDRDSSAFTNAALANPALQGRLAGLMAYGNAFHLRPGVEIVSALADGNLTVAGDIDLSSYRYGPDADRDTTSPTYGAGEAMGLTLRAGGNVTVKGSMSDGYRLIAAGQPGGATPIPNVIGNPDFTSRTKNVWIDDVRTRIPYYDNKKEVTLASDWVIPSTDFYVLGVVELTDKSGNQWQAGSTVPAGTTFQPTQLPLETAGSATWPALQYVIQATAPTYSAPLAGTATALRLVAGADLNSAASRALAAASLLDGRGNITLNNPIFSSMLNVPATSMLRTGAADLDLLAGGDITQATPFNISTYGNGDMAPADLFVKAQGVVSGRVYKATADTFDNITSNVVSRWYGQQGKNFTGFGALNAGNVTLIAGADAGMREGLDINRISSAGFSTTALTAGIQGGGDVILKVGGWLNPVGYGAGASLTQAYDDYHGAFSTDRGDITLQAGRIGIIPLVYGTSEINDPRQPNRLTAAAIDTPLGGPMLLPRDGSVSVRARGDMVVGGYGSAGPSATLGWSAGTSVSLFSAGGNLVPIDSNGRPGLNTSSLYDGPGGLNQFHLPGSLSATAASGSIFVQGSMASYSEEIILHLDAAPRGGLELLAGDSIFGAATYNSVGIMYHAVRFEVGGSNIDPRLHEGDVNPIRAYAVGGDIVNLVLGESRILMDGSRVHVGAKPARVLAGRDMVGFGLGTSASVRYNPNYVLPSFILHNDATDISVLRAGRNMYYTNVEIAGPGTLEVSAGGDIYQGFKGTIVSMGPIAEGDNRPGASISIIAGAGSAGANYDALLLYLDPANSAVAGIPLASQVGKVAKTYEAELIAWLKKRYGYVAVDDSDARRYFGRLEAEPQRVFLREVYYAELTAGGREYNDTASSRYGSYLRGRQAIAALFPEQNVYRGDLVMFSGSETVSGSIDTKSYNSGIRTLFGGDIQIMTPGGQQVIGVEGVAPGANAGVVTQGQGNIQLYANGSILLGQSRIMTTFGGNILGWSATGDINAGRGSKTTVLYTPPKRVYDDYGNVTLSPDVPSSGAGIATLNPIPEVVAGDIDLIAPLGTIDAGEAGIRVSGNVNLAALQILNAANIQVQGTAAGIPTVQAPNITAALTTSNATAATQQTATPTQGSANTQPSVIIVEVLGYGGADSDDDAKRRNGDARSGRQGATPIGYDPNSKFQVIGNGDLTEAQKKKLTDSEREGL